MKYYEKQINGGFVSTEFVFMPAILLLLVRFTIVLQRELPWSDEEYPVFTTNNKRRGGVRFSAHFSENFCGLVTLVDFVAVW